MLLTMEFYSQTKLEQLEANLKEFFDKLIEPINNPKILKPKKVGEFGDQSLDEESKKGKLIIQTRRKKGLK